MKKVYKKKIFEPFFAFLFIFILLAAFIAIIYRCNELRLKHEELLNAETREYIVQEGDRLWTIAQQTGFENDPRDIISRIKELNNLDSVNIYPGDVIIIPIKDN